MGRPITAFDRAGDKLERLYPIRAFGPDNKANILLVELIGSRPARSSREALLVSPYRPGGYRVLHSTHKQVKSGIFFPVVKVY